MQLRGKKPIVYLDQNWLSEITKAHIDGWKGGDKPYFEKLSSDIQAGVDKDRFVCPTSPFHESESSFNSKLYDPLWNVSEGLSRGLSFNSHTDISHKQLVGAALEFTGHLAPTNPWWRVPFNRDPDTSVSNIPRHEILVHLSVEELAEEQKRLRDNIQTPMYHKYKEMRRGYSLSYEDEVKYSKTQLFEEGYRGPMMALALPEVSAPGWDPLLTHIAWEQMNRYEELIRICDQRGGLDTFLDSPQFSKAPFLSIRAKLMAADIARFPRRKPEPSLQDDFSIVATVLPYADVFATENYIADLIKQTHVGSDYDCRVFTMRQKDDLLEYLSAL